MATYGDYYPYGYANTIATAATTYSMYLTNPQITYGAGAVQSPSPTLKPKTAVDWLRARVEEVCEEAYAA